MITRYPVRLLIFFSAMAAIPAAALPQNATVPGTAIGTATGAVDGTAFSVSLDCSGWASVDREVWSIGDDTTEEDLNADGIVIHFRHQSRINRSRGTLVLKGRELSLANTIRPSPGSPQWQVSDTGATWDGESPGFRSANVQITIDCSPEG